MWHADPAQLADALRRAGSSRVQRVHVFQMPPGLLGGIYAASFADGEGAVHRCLVSYANDALLGKVLRPLREAIDSLALPTPEGRVEVGANTGEELHYFLPSVEESDSKTQAQKKRGAARRAWRRVASQEARELQQLSAPEVGEVLCASAPGRHLLIRFDATWQTTAEEVAAGLGLPLTGALSPESSLGRDILGEWRDG